MEIAHYASPEYAGTIARDLRQASDLYSLGVFFFLVFTNQFPFLGVDLHGLLVAHITQIPDWKLLDEMPNPLSMVVKHLLQIEPSSRYQTSQSVVDDLLQIKQHLISQSQVDFCFAPGADRHSTSNGGPQFWLADTLSLKKAKNFFANSDFSNNFRDSLKLADCWIKRSGQVEVCCRSHRSLFSET